ncbi:MAG: menaquinone-dependent protoporphyrinogen oxidase [Solirubrobacteraceae bacterium]|jgi:menaquinone-dependent protoporphyrinogen oxidase|nr:menaquinone-dependent protoporphyrinogen oxidase [Solirubrobacteraceae bacterium]
MTGRILVAYATEHGSTIEVAEAIATALRDGGDQADVRPAGDMCPLDGYRAVVLGGALYMGRFHPDAARFLKRHRQALCQRPLAVFAIGPKTLAAADVAASRKQLDHALAAVPDVKAAAVAIFGGVVDPSKLRFPFKRMPASDARDWEAIGAWGHEVASLFAGGVGAVSA